MSDIHHFSFPAVGIIRSCFKEKFAVPRQPGLVPAAQAWLELLAPYNDPDVFDGLECGSHIWLLFVFHLNKRQKWKAKVKPPRLGGNRQMGVFATRSPVRPSAIGLSAVKLDAIEGSRLKISGVDLVDGTPVIDIKPYLPYSDCITQATNSIAAQAPERMPVVFSEPARKQCAADASGALEALISQTLALDPRPQYQKRASDRLYGALILDKNIRWQYFEDHILVIDILDV